MLGVMIDDLMGVTIEDLVEVMIELMIEDTIICHSCYCVDCCRELLIVSELPS